MLLSVAMKMKNAIREEVVIKGSRVFKVAYIKVILKLASGSRRLGRI